MANIEITDNSTGTMVIFEPLYSDDTLTFTAADVYAAGTILARDSSTLKLIAYVKGGTTDGNGIPKVILPYEVEATAAGDVSVSTLISGRVRQGDLVIDADGDDSNVDAAVLDELRNYGIIAQETTQLAETDNQ